jgi:hypothetical protein
MMKKIILMMAILLSAMGMQARVNNMAGEPAPRHKMERKAEMKHKMLKKTCVMKHKKVCTHHVKPNHKIVKRDHR